MSIYTITVNSIYVIFPDFWLEEQFVWSRIDLRFIWSIWSNFYVSGIDDEVDEVKFTLEQEIRLIQELMLWR